MKLLRSLLNYIATQLYIDFTKHTTGHLGKHETIFIYEEVPIIIAVKCKTRASAKLPPEIKLFDFESMQVGKYQQNVWILNNIVLLRTYLQGNNLVQYDHVVQ